MEKSLRILSCKCPQCGARFKISPDELKTVHHFPFCSARCKLLDLGKWADEAYRIESSQQVEDAEDSADA